MFRPLSLFNRNTEALPARTDACTGDPFFRLQHEMNRLFDDAFAGFGPSTEFRSDRDDPRLPRIDLRESDHAIEVDAELPGVDEKDLKVEISDNLLTISGEKRVERKESKDGEYRVTERCCGAFARSMSLPFAVDPDAVEARFRNGVLKLTLPKPPKAQARSKRIAIKAS